MNKAEAAEAVAKIAQDLYIAWSRGRLAANEVRWKELGEAIDAWDPSPLTCKVCHDSGRPGFIRGKCPTDALCLACDRHGSHYEPCPGCGGEAT